MATLCRNVHTWVETDVERPVESWENSLQRYCGRVSCNWWTLCLNVVFCWFAWVLLKVVRFVVVTIGKWVVRVVCEVVNFVADIVAIVVNVVLSIPILGGIVRTVLNWVTEVVWRIVGLVDLVLGAFGVRPRKKMYVGLLIPTKNGTAITTEAAMLPLIRKAQEIYLRLCNVEIVYTGYCEGGDAPGGVLTFDCGAGGFFADWWLAGSYLQASTATCKFHDGWRRLTGYGGELVVVAVENVQPDSPSYTTTGCSFASTHDYVAVEPSANVAMAAHEIGHACWLGHSDDAANLMTTDHIAAAPTLTASQVALVRWSKHCVYA